MLTDLQRRSFWSSGYLPLGQVAAPHQARALRDEFETMTNPTCPAVPEDHLMRSLDGSHIRVGLHLCHLSSLFRTLAIEPAVMDMMGTLFGEEPAALTCLGFNKPPRIGEELLAHQDLAYYPYLGPDDLITCWIALDDVDLANGAMQYLPGTHRAAIEHERTGLQQALAIDAASLDEKDAVAVTLTAGEAVAHHGLTVHRSAPNTSGRPRLGVAILYIRASVKVSAADFPYPAVTREPEDRA